MPRASWRGFLRLSLVSCPIYLSPATTRTKPIRLHQVWQPALALIVGLAVHTVRRPPPELESADRRDSWPRHYFGVRRVRRFTRSARARISPAKHRMQAAAPRPPNTAISNASAAAKPSAIAPTPIKKPTSNAHAPALIANRRRFSLKSMLISETGSSRSSVSSNCHRGAVSSTIRFYLSGVIEG